MTTSKRQETSNAELAASFVEPTDRFHRRFAARLKAMLTLELLTSVLPILGWLPRYRVPDLMGDLLAGVTTGGSDQY